MNYYGPRQIEGSDPPLYHYCRESDARIFPVGFCSAWESCPDCIGNIDWRPLVAGGPHCITCDGTRLVKATSPCPGHRTPEMACAHYKAYLISRASITRKKIKKWPKTKCVVEKCQHEASHVISIPCGILYNYEVCGKHATMATLQTLLNVGERISSC